MDFQREWRHSPPIVPGGDMPARHCQSCGAAEPIDSGRPQSQETKSLPKGIRIGPDVRSSSIRATRQVS